MNRQLIVDGEVWIQAKDIVPGDVLLGWAWKYAVTRRNPNPYFSEPFYVDRVTIGDIIGIFGHTEDDETGERKSPTQAENIYPADRDMIYLTHHEWVLVEL
jgi:hypothetical protein